MLRDRVWRRTRALGKEHGTLQLAHGRLDFTSSQGETLSLTVSEITKISAAPWRSGRVTITAGGQRHVFGFDPRRLGDGTWEEGEIRKQEGDRAGGTGIADASLDPSGGVSSSQGVIDAYEFASGLELIGVVLVGALEGNYARRIRRRDWRRVLRRERSAGELLTARAEKARAKLEQDDLLTSSFERPPPAG